MSYAEENFCTKGITVSLCVKTEKNFLLYFLARVFSNSPCPFKLTNY